MKKIKYLDRKEKEKDGNAHHSLQDSFYESSLALLTSTYNLPFSATGLFLVRKISEY